MATDLALIVKNFRDHCALAGRQICTVGAGGGQLVDVYHDAAWITAVDVDAAALTRLKSVLEARGLADKSTLVNADFLEHHVPSDLVIFEFSLHEMEDPARALAHALELAPQVFIYDHAPNSPWAWQVVEETKVPRSWAALNARAGLKHWDFRGEQHFAHREELEAKAQSQGPEALLRAATFPSETPITIEMNYFCAHLNRT